MLQNEFSVRVRNGGILNIGNNVAFNNNCTLTCRGKITIGSDTNIGPNCAIFDHDHDYMSKNRMENYKIGSILIGKNVWIGANVTILKNSVMGRCFITGDVACLGWIRYSVSVYLSELWNYLIVYIFICNSSSYNLCCKK